MRGGVPERSNGAALKAVDGASRPWVQIPPPPPHRPAGIPEPAAYTEIPVAGFRPVPRLVTLVVVGGLVAVGSGAFAADRSVESTGKAVVRLTDRQVRLTHFGGDATGSGDVARMTLYGSSSPTRPIGHAVITCMDVGSGEQSCEGSYVLPKGTLVTAGVLRTRLLYTQAVVGGTGLFDNARGTLTVTAKNLSPRREILLFRLTG